MLGASSGKAKPRRERCPYTCGGYNPCGLGAGHRGTCVCNVSGCECRG